MVQEYGTPQAFAWNIGTIGQTESHMANAVLLALQHAKECSTV